MTKSERMEKMRSTMRERRRATETAEEKHFGLQRAIFGAMRSHQQLIEITVASEERMLARIAHRIESPVWRWFFRA